jgi:hypothetical protein
VVEAERVADGEHPLAHARGVGISELGDRKSLTLDADHRDVGEGVPTPRCSAPNLRPSSNVTSSRTEFSITWWLVMM